MTQPENTRDDQKVQELANKLKKDKNNKSIEEELLQEKSKYSDDERDFLKNDSERFK